MRILLIFLLVIFLTGCTYDEAKRLTTFMEDPHYAQYKKQLDSLEKSYLDKEISYAEYLRRKEQIDEQYTKEVQKRERIIHQGLNE